MQEWGEGWGQDGREDGWSALGRGNQAEDMGQRARWPAGVYAGGAGHRALLLFGQGRLG